MANTLEDLYFKYIDGVGQNLEDDRYFQYLYTMVEAGNNILQQKHQILRKVVDERWIATIEDSLDAINNIIDNPRRFITTSEEVVPVSLAKKITADSVRHLSMNTQFIATNEEGDIMPSKILNVTTEESYDLYENRFIYHLIYRLIAFVDKRTDVIFWSTGDETSNILSMESNVDDAYEQINYKIQMTIKNTQSLVENDSDNMQVFMRIDRIRRLVFALRNSAFFSLMAGCSKVQSPIQRTNLMMKDPNYRTCYKLWQFLESYDEVGYTIEPIDSTLEFDEEYLIQMYTNMITNYTVFKSILETDERDLKELEKKVREPIKPKFVKEIKEEIVDSRDIPDVEVRQVFLEEVTQAQLDAEAKLEETSKELEEVKKQLEETEEAETNAQIQLQDLYQQLDVMTQARFDAEDEVEKITEEKETRIKELEGQLEEQKTSYEGQLEEQKTSYEGQLEEQKTSYEGQLEEQKTSYEEETAEQIHNLQTEHTQILEETTTTYEKQLTSLRQDYETQISKQKQGYETQILEQKQGYETQLSELKEGYEAKLSGQETDYEAKLSGQETDYETRLLEQKQSYEAKISEQKQGYETQISEQKQGYETQISEQKQNYEARLSELKEGYEAKLSGQETDYETRLSEQKQNYEGKSSDLRRHNEEILHKTKTAHEEELAKMQEKYETMLRELSQKQEEQKQAEQKEMEKHYNDLMKQLEEEKQAAIQEAKEARSRVKYAEKAQKKAEEKSEGTRLSRYIIASISGKNKKHTREQEEETISKTEE